MTAATSIFILHMMMCTAAGNAKQYDFGRSVEPRPRLSYDYPRYNVTKIPESNVIINVSGVVARWQFFARYAGRIFLQIWRPVDLAKRQYLLVGQEEWYIRVPKRKYTVYGANKIIVEEGDTLGFYTPGAPIIPYDLKNCAKGTTLYFKGGTIHQSKSSIYRFNKLITSRLRPCRQFSLKVTVVTPSTLHHGDKVMNRKSLDRWKNAMYILNPGDPIPMNGEVTKWAFFAEKRAQIFLQVWRKVGGSYRLVGQTVFNDTSYGPNSKLLMSNDRIQVRKGDLLGIYFPGSSVIPFTGRSCSKNRTLYVKNPTDVFVGKRFIFKRKQTGWKPCRRYSLLATVTYYKLSSMLDDITLSNSGGRKATYGMKTA